MIQSGHINLEEGMAYINNNDINPAYVDQLYEVGIIDGYETEEGEVHYILTDDGKYYIKNAIQDHLDNPDNRSEDMQTLYNRINNLKSKKL